MKDAWKDAKMKIQSTLLLLRFDIELFHRRRCGNLFFFFWFKWDDKIKNSCNDASSEDFENENLELEKSRIE
jgi:hypothetical protein